MHEQEEAIVRALVPIAWADGVFAEKERETLLAILDAYRATDDEKKQFLDYAGTKRTLDDINLQDLSFSDRRVLLQQAVLITFVDGEQAAAEGEMLTALATKLKIPETEAKEVIGQATDRAKKLLHLL